MAFTRLIGLNYYEERDGVKIGYHDFEKSKIISYLFVLFQLIDVWLASVLRFWAPLIADDKRVIISDRGPYDTLLDVALDTGEYFLPTNALGKLFYKSVLYPHKVFHIKRNRNIILLDRPDIKHDRKFTKREELYLSHEKDLEFTGIENNGRVDDTVSQIIRELLHEKEGNPFLDIQ